MKNYIASPLVLLILVGCASVPNKWDPHRNYATQKAHKEVLQDLDGPGRVPARANDLGVALEDLRQLSPGKFEVYLFPKVSSQTNRELVSPEEHLGPPRVFEVSIVAVSACKDFISTALFAKYRPNEAFPEELSTNNQRQCAIIEILDRKLAKIDKGLLRPDDQLSVRLFIDDAYTIHALDQVLFGSRNKDRVVRRLSDGETLTSGLSYFPLDLNLLGSIDKGEISTSFRGLDKIGKYQIKKRHNRSFEPTKCEGAVVKSKDPLGGHTKVGWCQGIPWPAYSENRRFLSVTQQLRVR